MLFIMSPAFFLLSSFSCYRLFRINHHWCPQVEGRHPHLTPGPTSSKALLSNLCDLLPAFIHSSFLSLTPSLANFLPHCSSSISHARLCFPQDKHLLLHCHLVPTEHHDRYLTVCAGIKNMAPLTHCSVAPLTYSSFVSTSNISYF